MTVLNAVVPTQMLGKVQSKDAVGKAPLDWMSSASFGSTFAGILNTSTANAATQASTLASDSTAQLTALLQNGTSLSTIINTIAQSVSGSVAQQLSGKFSQNQIASLKSSISECITNALSPPANAPPGTAAQEAAALAARLQNLISAVARDTENLNGQQNEISGTVLDANSAKELPAQQKTNNASSALDVSGLVSSLLANVAAILNAPANGPGDKTGSPMQPTSAFSSIAASAQSPNAQAIGPAASPSNSATPAPITIANAPDLLARMLVRAAGADATLSGGAAASNATSNGSDGSLTATALAARFASAIADGATTAASNGSGGAGAGWSNHGFDSANQSPSSASTPANANGAAVAPLNLNALTQQLSQPLQSPAPGVDVNSVVEQMVKSMTMRTTAQGASEIRLNLQPENLGALTMRLTVNGSQISASVVAQNADVRNALMSNHQQLARSLSSAGLTLSGFSVDVSGGDSKQQNQGQSGLGRRYVVHELNAPTEPENTAISALGPPLNGGSGVTLFNYLA